MAEALRDTELSWKVWGHLNRLVFWPTFLLLVSILNFFEFPFYDVWKLKLAGVWSLEEATLQAGESWMVSVNPVIPPLVIQTEVQKERGLVQGWAEQWELKSDRTDFFF